MSFVNNFYTHQLEDESISGSIIIKTNSDTTYIENRPQSTLRDRMIDYVATHNKPTKSDILINVSSSGTAQVLVTGLLKSGIFIEHKFDCNHCTYYTLDKSKIGIV